MFVATTGTPPPRSVRKILHLWSGNLYGGIERFLSSLAETGRAEHHFGLCFDGRLAAEIREKGANLHLIPAARLRSPRSLARSRAAVSALIVRLRPEAVVTHSHWPAAVWGSAVRANALRWVFYAHDLRNGHGLLGWLGSRAKPDLVVANSRFTATGYVDRLRTTVIHYPVARALVSRTRSEIREGHGAGNDEVVLLQVSRMQPWKGHSVLLRSLASLRSLPTWRLWFMGGAQRPEECRYEAGLRNEARQLGIEERVAFLGERANVFEFMSAADVLCQMNERPEPFGLVFVEALSQGLPVVALASGGIPEIVTPDCGILTSKGMLTAAVETLVRDSSLRCRLAANGPARATELCDPERQTARIEAAILGDAGCA